LLALDKHTVGGSVAEVGVDRGGVHIVASQIVHTEATINIQGAFRKFREHSGENQGTFGRQIAFLAYG
jgi:hypothetical protein